LVLPSFRSLAYTVGVKTAEHWRRLDSGLIECGLCPHGCRLKEGADGICRVRGVRENGLVALSYGAVSSTAMDPIEKKPLYHFRPGATIYSVGGWGCSFRCSFCQNWTISQRGPPASDRYAPRDLVAAARRQGSEGIAYTYNEPLIAWEFVRDCAAEAREAGLFNVLVTNGFICPCPARELLPFLQALNIDVKSMDGGFYRRHCGGALEPVQRFAVQAVQAGCHVEITNLLIPGLNDSDETVTALADWVRESLGESTPLHLSAYRPMYRMTVPATELRVLERAFEICRARLSYVFLGNVRSGKGRDSVCPACGAVLVARSGYATQVVGIRENACSGCGRACPEIVGA